LSCTTINRRKSHRLALPPSGRKKNTEAAQNIFQMSQPITPPDAALKNQNGELPTIRFNPLTNAQQ